MRWLEHKLPPPIVAALLGLAMWAVARISPRIQIEANVRSSIAIALAVFGIAVALLGAAAFRKAKTTLNALNPQASSSLVVTGIYRYSRNPMYLGLGCVLLAWAVYLAAPFALAGPVLFVLFITRFQIIPEERALRAKFGPEFTRYTSEVRRWL
jgi:protein-S-isoprenylcysteine O-methyltransferase Ste14